MYRTKVNGHAMYPPFQGIIESIIKPQILLKGTLEGLRAVTITLRR